MKNYRNRKRISADGFIADSPGKYDNLELRELESHRFQPKSAHPIPVDFHFFFDAKIWPLLDIGGYKVAAKRELLIAMCHALVVSYHRCACVADTANSHYAGIRRRVILWQSLVDAGLARKCCGSEFSGKVTRYAATRKLTRLQDRWTLEQLVDLKLQRNSQQKHATPHGLVFQHSGKTDPATGKLLHEDDRYQPVSYSPDRCGAAGLSIIRELEDAVEAFNANNLNHTWRYTSYGTDGRKISSPLNPCVRYLFIGGFMRFARFYGWSRISFQAIRKEERQTIEIDSRPVAELDFSASILRMVYHTRGLDPNGDLYRPDCIFNQSWPTGTHEQQEILRAFVKAATIICLNVQSRKRAHSSVGKLMAQSEHRRFLRESVFRTEATNAIGLVQRILDAHAELITACKQSPNRIRLENHDKSEPFFTQAGAWLVTQEGWVMKRVMKSFVEARKPMLPIHDAVVVKIEDLEFAKAAMIDAYQWVLSTEFVPVIKRAF